MSEKSVPAAGCPKEDCEAGAWVIVLDDFPPNHTKITHFVCAACHYAMEVSILIGDMRDRSNWEEVKDGSTQE
jgi:hypothetical protein